MVKLITVVLAESLPCADTVAFAWVISPKPHNNPKRVRAY